MSEGTLPRCEVHEDVTTFTPPEDTEAVAAGWPCQASASLLFQKFQQ